LESDTSQRHTALETAYRQVILCIELGESCVHRDPTKRPCIRDIIDRLAEMEASEESSVTISVISLFLSRVFSLIFFHISHRPRVYDKLRRTLGPEWDN
jgi:hypothetical protein